jgi:hypothetical protein
MARECRPFILALAVQTLLSQVRYRNAVQTLLSQVRYRNVVQTLLSQVRYRNAVQTLLSQVRYRNQTKGQFYHPKTLTGVQSVAMNA